MNTWDYKTIIELTSKALDSSRKIAHGYCPVLEKFGLHELKNCV
jgi:hypothetical protein